MLSVRPLLWLLLGGLLSVFSYSSPWTIPAASWLAPVFLPRFVRTQGPWSLAGVWLVSMLAVGVAHREVIKARGCSGWTPGCARTIPRSPTMSARGCA
jgi:hypothetical protein